MRIVGGDFVTDIQLAFAGKIVGTKRSATKTATYDIFATLPKTLVDFLPWLFPFFESEDFARVPFFESNVFIIVPFFKISEVMTANPTDASIITEVAVKSSNLAKVPPA